MSKYTITDFHTEFPNNDACLEYLFTARYSKQCSCGGTYRKLPSRAQYQCSGCRKQIAPRAGTIFEKSTTPLTLWFYAIFVFSNAKSGISAAELQRQIGVTYKTAWRMLKLIRTTLQQDTTKLSGTVEMDEAFFGGKARRRRGKDLKKKSIVAGAVERDGELRAQVIPWLTAGHCRSFITKHIAPDAKLYTDDSNRYPYAAKGYDRQSVNHSQKEYVRGDVHVNTLEGFWNHVKNSSKGTHKVISPQHLQTYLDGFVWHRNHRHYAPRDRFYALVGRVVS